MDHLETIRSKRTAQKEAQHQEVFDDINVHLKELRKSLAKRPTDLTGIVKKLDALLKDGRTLNKHQSDQLRDIKDAIETVQVDLTPIIGAIEQIAESIKGIKLPSPVVNVPQPKVVIEEREINFSPLLDALKKPDTVDLTCFRAQDLDNAPDGTQYVGFTDTNGAWYILKNDETTLRYHFGIGNYEDGWSNRIGHEYLVLSEAVNAIRS